MTYTTTVTSDTYVVSTYSCLPSEAVVSFTSIEAASSVLMLLENQIRTDISLSKLIITRITGPIQTVTQTVQEIMTAAKHRRWKGLQGSPSHTHIKSSSKDKPMDTTTSTVTTTSSTSKDKTASPACTSFNPFLAGDFPSVPDKVGDPHDLLRFACGQTAELESECPYLCGGRYLSIFLSGCFDTDISGPISDCNSQPFCSVFCEHCNAPTIQPKPSSTCTAVDPAHPTCPPVIDNNDNDPTVRYQTACGNTTEAIAECPYLCTGIPTAGEFHCEQSDVSGTIFDGSAEVQACHKCLPACQNAV